MTEREKLIDLAHDYFKAVPWYADIADLNPEELIDHLLVNGVTFTPAIPGPSDTDPNIMELCFHNGERHMKEKIILLLDAFDKDYTFEDPYIAYDALRKAMEDL